MICTNETKAPSYRSYRNNKFKRYLDKARNLKNGIDSTSLKPKDKELIKKEIIRILS